jgi:predicted mannosyl-3-phosphoglycerate phosphatase (HAD superfamily)
VHSQTATAHEDSASASLVIFTRVEGLLREGTHAASAASRASLRFLTRQGVPLVLVSAWDAAKIQQMQRDVALHQPFISEEGAALHVPRTWVMQPDSAGRAVEGATAWEMVRLSPRSIGAAVRLVSAMFLARGHHPLLTVGIGCDLADYELLTAVDIPIVVRASSVRQPDLLRQLPGVYVTSAPGAAGWSEAVLGRSQ